MPNNTLCILYTGGTFGMRDSPEGLRPAEHWLGAQLANCEILHHTNMPKFELHEYAPLLDSSDITPEHWQRIAQDIQAKYHQYAGFVIIHGTDTMAYSAAALHYLLPNLAKPVIFTGSQLPWAYPNSDAPNNLRNALYAATYASINSVSLLFDKKLIAGDKASKFDAQNFAGFISLNAPELLTWEDEFLQLDETQQSIVADVPDLQVLLYTAQKIAVLHFHPGMTYEWLAPLLQQPWDSLILHSFGSGNIPQNSQLKTLLENTHQQGVRLINCTQCPSGAVQQSYRSGFWLAQLGVVSAGNKSIENTIAWAHLGCPV